MKNKIIVLIISAALLLACLPLAVFAEGETLYSDPFKITSPQENTTFRMREIDLSEISNTPEKSKKYINEMFDTLGYDASFYGAYKASLFIDNNEVPFTDDIDVTINIGDEYTETDVFIFSIDPRTGIASAKAPCEKDGTNFTVSGEDFADMSDDIIIVMTGVTASKYTVIPAVICASVALIAIIASVMLVKRKASKETITE